MEIFTLAEASDILNMPTSLVKAWTIGRPFCFVPKAKQAKGSGTRNLYNRENLYAFGMVYQMVTDGFSIPKITGVAADLVRARPAFVVIEQAGGRLTYELYPPRTRWATVMKREKGVFGKYVLDCSQLCQRIDERIRDFQERKGEKRK